MRLESGLQIGHKLEKWQWLHSLLTWRHRQFFWRCFVSLVRFSYWSKFYVNIITGSGVGTIFFYKWLTRNPETENTPFWVLPNIWRLDWVRNAKFGTNAWNGINPIHRLGWKHQKISNCLIFSQCIERELTFNCLPKLKFWLTIPNLIRDTFRNFFFLKVRGLW